jgi:hypothetical protein
MATGIVKNKLKGAINGLAEKEGVDVKSIAAFIHTKEMDGEDNTYKPTYFYTVDGNTKKDEAGNQVSLTYNELMGQKFDFTPVIHIVTAQLKSYFKTLEEVYEIDAKELYLMIGCTDQSSEAENLVYALFHNQKPLKELTLEEVVGDE